MRTPRPAAWWIVPVTLLVGGVVGGLAWLLLGAGWSAAEATARQGAIQTALAAGAGVGAAVTLMLAFRRQRHQEHAAHVTAYLAERNAQLTEQIAERNAALAEQVADNTKHDATERRVTELYTKAVEQLGHAGAAVRLGGLYALERLAQDNPGHRQTIVNVICAYLRMPYAPPPTPDPVADRAEALRAARRRHHALRTAARGRTTPPPAPAGTDTGQDTEGERQVRLTAQRILTDHLRDERPADQRSTLPAAPTFWERMRLDLTGATLIDFDLTDGHVTDARFTRATFTGGAWFERASFTGTAIFDRASFTRGAWFVGATFTRYVRFVGATFTRTAVFDGATFTGYAGFDRASFTGTAGFDGASFTEDAGFNKAAFTGYANFHEATFTEPPRLGGAVVVDPAAAHVWPDGWRLETTAEGTGRLIREETDRDPAQGA
ncbi:MULTISPECIES: pentapeptide repeat-containing protein [Streptosporangium]|uniref:Pentapeptide repeat-containing protein n=1 Tax=Streptosporangium brasiliense TaxID=47480 RepID=A0ABT9RIK8_9ACTN|nr:pentapeptide repeat-containing protein [Streptosporangium brasiliense]MDP9869131.1 hypothetical protein [Streptosporangium brasiliense]